MYKGEPEASNNFDRSSKDIVVFISYAREDGEAAQRLYNNLKTAGLDPWLDKERLLPSQNWNKEIVKTIIEKSRYFIPLFSSASVRAERGFVHKEIKLALDVFEEYPPGMTFILPVKLDDCKIPYSDLRDIEYVDLFPLTNWEAGLRRILQIILNKPMAVAKPNRAVVKPGEIVTLYGDHSRDLSGQKLRYYWEEIPKQTILTDENAINPQFTAPIVDHETVFTFRLKVTNESGAEDSTEMQIRVKPIRPLLSIFPEIDDPNFDITFEYPVDWLKNITVNTIEISPPQRNEIPISISQAESSLDIALPVKFKITVEVRNQTSDSLSYYSNDFINRITQPAKYSGQIISKIIHDTDMKLNSWLDNPAHRIQLRMKYPIEIQEQHLIIVTTDRLNVYSIHYSAGESNYYHYLDTVEKIIGSIRFL